MQLRINIPPLTRVLLALTLVTSTIFQIARFQLGSSKDFLALVPQRSLFYPWAYFTATFAEQNILTLFIAVATILFGGRYLERAWGSKEFGKFVLLGTLLPNFIASLLYVLWFAITREAEQALALSHCAMFLCCLIPCAAGLLFKAPLPCRALFWSPSNNLCLSIPSPSSKALSRSALSTFPPSFS